eukprot:14056789-Alexandrium_andersonii.AAC.1
MRRSWAPASPSSACRSRSWRYSSRHCSGPGGAGMTLVGLGSRPSSRASSSATVLRLGAAGAGA